MAKIVTIDLLVDDDEDCRICDGINEMLRDWTQPQGEGGVYGWLIDYAIVGHNLGMRDIPAHIEDSIVNETYEEGDAFK